MATPNTQRVPLELDRPRTLLLDLNAYCEAEEITDKNYMREAIWAELSFRDVRVLLYVGLKHEDDKLTLELVGAMVNTSNMTEVTNALTAAFLNSMPEPELEPKEGEADPLDISPEVRAIEREPEELLSLTPTC